MKNFSFFIDFVSFCFIFLISICCFPIFFFLFLIFWKYLHLHSNANKQLLCLALLLFCGVCAHCSVCSCSCTCLCINDQFVETWECVTVYILAHMKVCVCVYTWDRIYVCVPICKRIHRSFLSDIRALPSLASFCSYLQCSIRSVPVCPDTKSSPKVMAVFAFHWKPKVSCLWRIPADGALPCQARSAVSSGSFGLECLAVGFDVHSSHLVARREGDPRNTPSGFLLLYLLLLGPELKAGHVCSAAVPEQFLQLS